MSNVRQHYFLGSNESEGFGRYITRRGIRHMTKRKTWTAAAVLMSAMLVLTSACSSSKGGSPSSSPSSSAAVEAITDFAKQPEITLDVFSNLANFEGNQPGWFAKLVKDKFNIKLNIISGGQSK